MSRTNQTRYVVLNRGEVKIRLEGRTEPDGTIRLKNGSTWMPVVLGSECVSRGLDPRTVIATCAPVECLARLGTNGHIEVLDADEWDARRAAEAQAKYEREIAAGQHPLVTLARETGKPQFVEAFMTDRCMNHSEDCSFDHAETYVRPDGTYFTKYTCCH